MAAQGPTSPLTMGQTQPYVQRIDDPDRRVKSKFTAEEDAKLKDLVAKYGEKSWKIVSKEMPNRNSRQCRERWKNYLSPTVSQKAWDDDDDEILVQEYQTHGPRWNVIAKKFPGRSVNNVRNRWLKLARRMRKTGRKPDPAPPAPRESKSPFDLTPDSTTVYDIFGKPPNDLDYFIKFDSTMS